MILTPHLILGAAIAVKFQNPFFGFFFAFLSHYLIDLLPHQEYSILNIRNRKWQDAGLDVLKVTLDISFGLLLLLLLAKNYLIALTGAFFAVLPDGLSLLFFMFPENKLLKGHHNLHQGVIHSLNHKKNSLILEILSQVAVVLSAIFFLLQ